MPLRSRSGELAARIAASRSGAVERRHDHSVSSAEEIELTTAIAGPCRGSEQSGAAQRTRDARGSMGSRILIAPINRSDGMMVATRRRARQDRRPDQASLSHVPGHKAGLDCRQRSVIRVAPDRIIARIMASRSR